MINIYRSNRLKNRKVGNWIVLSFTLLADRQGIGWPLRHRLHIAGALPFAETDRMSFQESVLVPPLQALITFI